MADKLKNNIGLKIVALAFAFLLWFVVVNIDDPMDLKTYQVDVTVLNPEVITNAGKSYQVVDNTGNVAITVKARRKVLSKITPSNIVATADLKEMQDTSVPIRVKVTGFEGQYESISANPRNIQVKVENTQKKTFFETLLRKFIMCAVVVVSLFFTAAQASRAKDETDMHISLIRSRRYWPHASREHFREKKTPERSRGAGTKNSVVHSGRTAHTAKTVSLRRSKCSFT